MTATTMDLAAALLTTAGHLAGHRDVEAAAVQFRRLGKHVITITDETGHPPALALPPQR